MGSFYETDSEIWTVLGCFGPVGGKNNVVNFIVLCHELSIFELTSLFWPKHACFALVTVIEIDHKRTYTQ